LRGARSTSATAYTGSCSGGSTRCARCSKGGGGVQEGRQATRTGAFAHEVGWVGLADSVLGDAAPRA
jgi:hypothetical protein